MIEDTKMGNQEPIFEGLTIQWTKGKNKKPQTFGRQNITRSTKDWETHTSCIKKRRRVWTHMFRNGKQFLFH